MEHALSSIENKLTALESLDSATILDGGADRDHESELLRLDGEITELRAFLPSPLATRLNPLQHRLASVTAGVDHEICRRNEVYAQLLEAISQSSNRPALVRLKNAAMRQLPDQMWQRPELQAAICQADDRLIMAELECLEKQERSAVFAKLNSARGVDLANLLFREYGIDLGTARKLVIERNNGKIDLEQLWDRVLEIRRR
jgi:hypothetical protein